MPLPALLADLVATARHSVREASQHSDPSVPLGRAAWAVAEIIGKVEPDAEIEAAAQGVHRALDATLTKANQVAFVMSGLADEQDDALAAITALEAALTRARPNAITVAIGLGW